MTVGDGLAHVCSKRRASYLLSGIRRRCAAFFGKMWPDGKVTTHTRRRQMLPLRMHRDGRSCRLLSVWPWIEPATGQASWAVSTVNAWLVEQTFTDKCVPAIFRTKKTNCCPERFMAIVRELDVSSLLLRGWRRSAIRNGPRGSGFSRARYSRNRFGLHRASDIESLRVCWT